MKKENLLKRMQMRVLPASSRSFQSGLGELKGKLNDLQRENHEINKCLGELRKENAELRDSLHRMEKDMLHALSVNRKHTQLYAESLYRDEKESVREGRIRFFSQLPDAMGMLRLHQKVNVKLMEELNKICIENGIQYWFGYASLLGVHTRQAFIPWDDDIDICMLREDLVKLQTILKSHKEYQITVVYDYYVKVKQYRFSARDDNLICFIDIGVWDWVKEVKSIKEEKMKELRRMLMKELDEIQFDYWEERKYLFAPESGFVVQCAFVDYASQDDKKTKPELFIIIHFNAVNAA